MFTEFLGLSLYYQHQDSILLRVYHMPTSERYHPHESGSVGHSVLDKNKLLITPLVFNCL